MKALGGRSVVVASSLMLILGLAPLAWAKGAKPPKCGKQKFPASGQTTAYTADKNNGVGLDPVPDDGTVQAGATLRYQDNGDGTFTDLNTGLQWEMKDSFGGGSNFGNLHDADNTYRWSGDGTQETIWDWLDDINAEGGTGFAGHSDWRIPNVRELQTIAIYGVCCVVRGGYWSSTTYAANSSLAWFVSFGGFVDVDSKSGSTSVTAVRGGCL